MPLKIETVPIESLSPDPANARKHNAQNLAALTGSLRRFGQQKPIVVDAQNVIRAGNGTYQAASALGWKTIQIVRSDLPRIELTAFAIADNRTAELAEWDDKILAQLADAGELEQLGFSDRELKKLVNSLADDSPQDQIDSLPRAFEVVVECADETEQKQVFDQLKTEGRTCRLFTL